MHEFLTEKEDRLDRLLRSTCFPGSEWLSRSAWDRLLAEGKVRVAGKVAKNGGARCSASVPVSIDLPERIGLIPGDREAQCQWIDPAKRLAVFFKYNGFDSYPLVPWVNNTFANQIVSYLERQGIQSSSEFERLSEPPILEGGLLQRLDRDTTGLVCVALDRELKDRFRAAFAERKIEKKYLAIVSGEVEKCEGNHRLFYQPFEGKLMKAFREAKVARDEAELQVKVVSQAGTKALVEVRTKDGLRHVVRAGLQCLGAPLVGDRDYGGSEEASFHQLHAAQITLLDSKVFPAFPQGLVAAPPESFLETLENLSLKLS